MRNGETPLPWSKLIREERECATLFFVIQILLVGKMWVPMHSPIAQCFKYIGTIIPRYTIINYHLLTLGKII